MSDTVQVNGPQLVVQPKAEEPFSLTEAIGHATSPTGERIEILRAAGNPFTFVLRGEKLVGTVNFAPYIQEALLHVARENAK